MLKLAKYNPEVVAVDRVSEEAVGDREEQAGSVDQPNHVGVVVAGKDRPRFR